MSEIGKFFLTAPSGLVGDQVVGYSNTDLQEFNRTTFMTDPTVEGVMRGALNALAVSGTVTQVSVNTGYAMVYGLWYKNDLAFNIAIPTPTVSTRVDRIVARANMTSSTYAGQTGYTVRVVRITQSEGISTDVALTQNSSQWEIPLAKVSITTGGAITCTDQRTFLRPPVQISGDNLTSTVTYTGQWIGTKTSGGQAAAIYLNAANPFMTIASTTGSADSKAWDVGTLASDNSYVIRAVNDANSVATQAVQITRSGTTISAINLKAPTNVTGAFAASGGISGTTGSFSSTLAAGATTITGTISATNASVAGVINAGSTTISGTMTSNNASVAGLTATGTLTASGAATITGALASGTHTVTGNITASGQTAGATGAITGLLTAGSITTSGTMTANNASVTGLVASATMTASTSVTSPSFVGALTGNADTATTVANDAITNAKLANMAASTVKGRITGSTGDPEDLSAANVMTVLASAGNLAITGRQGGSATDWSSPGSTSRTIVSSSIQSGALTTDGVAVATVTFPVAFSNVPVVVASCTGVSAANTTMITALSATQVSFKTNNVSVTMYWIAIGPA